MKQWKTNLTIKRSGSYLTLILLFACHSIKENNTLIDTRNIIQPEEIYIDSLNIGNKTFNKIELLKYRTEDSIYVDINFYSKQNGKWVLKNTYQYSKDGITELDVKLSDFNNDGLNDLTYISGIAARGANEIRRLFIYNPKDDQLISMKNAESFPNMLYNKELDCIDAFLVYGGYSTVFLKISGDSLREFASVDCFEGLYVRTYDESGNEKIIFEDKNFLGEYDRYKNYDPLKVYEESDFQK
jgi:hypothetical protein